MPKSHGPLKNLLKGNNVEKFIRMGIIVLTVVI